MEFRLLGPLDVETDGDLAPIGSRQPRALLAILLLGANRVVSRDRLIEALWGTKPPERAANALQVHDARLDAELLDRTLEAEQRCSPEVVGVRRGGEVRDQATSSFDVPDATPPPSSGAPATTVSASIGRALTRESVAPSLAPRYEVTRSTSRTS